MLSFAAIFTRTVHSLTFKSTSTSSTDRARGFLTSSGLFEPFEYTLTVSLGITFRYLHDSSKTQVKLRPVRDCS
jgi:hypothetical protein